MKLLDFKDMKGGWFVGNFEPVAYKTKDFEVSYKIHAKNEKWDFHYHTEVTEINLLVQGLMNIQGKTLQSGNIFILEPYEIADPTFLEECHIVCVKVPSRQDKVVFTI
jgi:hypothetical protein